MRNKIQISQNKCIWFCQQLDKMTHISKSEFKTLIWLSVKGRFNHLITSIVFKSFTNQCSSYLNEISELDCLNNFRTTNNYLKLIWPFRKTNTGKNALSLISVSIWNRTAEVLKKKLTKLIIQTKLKKILPKTT